MFLCPSLLNPNVTSWQDTPPTCSICGLAQCKTAVDSTRLWFRHRRNSRSASAHRGVSAEQQFYLFIYYSNSLCRCVRLSERMCLGCIVSQMVFAFTASWQAYMWSLSGELNLPGTAQALLPFGTPVSGSSGSRVIQRGMCPLFLVQDIRFHAWLETSPCDRKLRTALPKLLVVVIPSKDFNSVGTKACQIIFCTVKYSLSL